MKLYFSLFLFLLLFAEYISYHVFTYNLKVLTVILFIYTVSMGVCVCVWIHRHVKIRLLWGCTFPGTKLSYGMRLYLLEHLTNPPILKHWKIKNWAVAQMEDCVCDMWEPLSLIPSMTWTLCGGTHLKSQDLGKWI